MKIRIIKNIIFLFSLVSSEITFAHLNLPSALTTSDRQTALEILGYSTAPKLLGTPYTLGGYEGVEIGYTTEIIPTAEIARLGGRAPQQSDLNYSVLTFGKGLFQNMDFYIQFGLLGTDEEMSNFGGQFRWTFFQAEYLPAFLTLVVGANSVTYQNLITANNQTADLVLGVSVDDITLYFGGGLIRSQGVFTGGAAGITDTGETLKENISGGHYVSGINLRFNKVFVALEIDRYTESVYSGKLGYRF
jgi:hypothetical protein